MKGLSYIHNLCESDRKAWFAEFRGMKAAEKALMEVYSETCTHSPAEFIDAAYIAIGESMTKTLIATYVYRKSWDGRISRKAADWAKAIESAWDEDAANDIGLYGDRIHPAHLDQTAREIMRREAIR